MDLLKPLFAGLVSALFLCHCGAPQPPRCVRVPAASAVPAPTLLAEARSAWRVLANSSRQDSWPAARAQYNGAITKLFDQLRCGPGDWQDRAAALGTRIAPASASAFDPGRFDALFPAVDVTTKHLGQRHLTAGAGLPLVGWANTTPVGVPRQPHALPTGIPHVTTATLDFSARGQPAWTFHKRWLQNEIRIGGMAQPLAADWTASNAFYWRMSDLDDLALRNVLLPSRLADETGLYFLHPYDPEKIPVVMVHGLASSPGAFKETINELCPEPWFRENYQIWLFCYPTGNPWTYSAANFRKALAEACAEARTQGPARKLEQMVVIGHSMGGLITRGSLTDPGPALFQAKFGSPPNGISGSDEHRRLVSAMFLYQPLPEPKRAVFLATPHRGSPLADLRISVWVSRLIRLPKTLTIDLLDEALQTVTDLAEGGPDNLSAHPGTSIGTLSPLNPLTQALGEQPLPAIPCHSVIGDRGRADSPDSSDGVVPYWSSHLGGVVSEKIVPAGHSVQQHPDTNAEIKRILLLHLRESGTGAKPSTTRRRRSRHRRFQRFRHPSHPEESPRPRTSDPLTTDSR
jgi:pimeloyl-ACP methyl ester carboxylesterase